MENLFVCRTGHIHLVWMDILSRLMEKVGIVIGTELGDIVGVWLGDGLQKGKGRNYVL